MGTITPRYFIWRLTDCEPWRVRGTRNHIFPPKDGLQGFLAWHGDDYHDALAECRNLNAYDKKERRGTR